MSHTLTVSSVTFTDVELTLPDVCPACKADFTAGAQLTEVAYDIVWYRHLTLDIDPDDPESATMNYDQNDSERGEDSQPIAYQCGACGHEFKPDCERDEEPI